MTRSTSTLETPRTRTGTGPALVVLAVGAWLATGWLALYPDLGYAPVSGVVAGVVLLALALLQLQEPSRGLWAVLAWTGVVVAVLPEAFRFGIGGRETAAHVDHAVCGLVVLLAAARGRR